MSIRIPGMPLLPGTLVRDVTKSNYPRVQKFLNLNGVNMLSDRKPPSLVNEQGMIEDANCPPYEMPSFYAPKVGPKLPPWLAYNQKVLCFYGYFQETLQEVYRAAYQVRKVKVYYYLEDGTMQVSEPRIENSGIPQGCLVSRQRIPRPAPCQHEFLSVLDINVNSAIRIFDRIYHITGCDLFTRHFLNRAGIHVPDPIETPIDPTSQIRLEASTKPFIPSTKTHEFAQFLKYDRKVLRFSGYWDDRSEFGDVRNLEICYYLADDTIEVKEIFPVNSGRDAPGTFLKRGKLRKEWTGLPLPGQETRVTILNVLGKNLKDGRYVQDVLATGSKQIDYYKDCDLQIGAHLNIFGRDMILTDCDPFTQEYYRKKYGIEDFTPLPNMALNYQRCFPIRKEKDLPPFNGWGSHEDSEGNCLSVIPKPKHIDLKKFIYLDRFILRFGAKMISTIKENCERIFIISYYLADDTISIFELAERNSGFLGGEFFKKAKILLPKQDLLTSGRPKSYKPHHFFIGSTLNIRDHVFHIVSADEYTLLYMENHPFEFPYADIETIMTKIREAVRPEYKNFVAKYMPEIQEIKAISSGGYSPCFIGSDVLKNALIHLLGTNITNHEIITVCRHFSLEKPPIHQCNRETIRAAVHLEIQRNLWDSLERLTEHIYHLEPDDVGFISETKLRSTIIACRLPFPKDLTSQVLSVLNRNHKGDIEICDFINFIDTATNPAPAIEPLPISAICPKVPFLSRGNLVDWMCFLCKIGLEEDLKKQTI